MESALAYLIGDLSPQEQERFAQWQADDAGADLLAFMEGLDSYEPLISALQEVWEAERDRAEYVRRMEAVTAFSTSLKNLQNLPHWA